MLHPKFKHKLISFHHDSFGRLVTLTLKINQINYRFINVYCPNNCSERKKFIISLESFCHCKMHLFIGGDFNFTENSEMDKLGGNTRRGHVGKKIMNLFKRNLNCRMLSVIYIPKSRSLHGIDLEYIAV